MIDAKNYLPGCYRNVELAPGESLGGYLLRVAEANGYSGIGQFLRGALGRSSRSVEDLLLMIRVNASNLQSLGRMTAGDPEYLMSFLAESLTRDVPLPGAIFYEDCRIDSDALARARSAVCPQCLAEDGTARADWDIAPISVCSRHRVMLRDECAICHAPISWRRTALLACGSCGADLRLQESELIDDAALIATAEDFAALAPFRLRDDLYGTRVVYWDEMFRLFKAMLLPDAEWATNVWPIKLVRSASIRERFQALHALARARTKNGYDVTRLAWKAHQALAPLGALPNQDSLVQFVQKFLEVEAGLSAESADAVSGVRRTEHPAAADIYKGRPPVRRTAREVAAQLGVGVATVDALIRMGHLRPPLVDHDGFDADEVFSAGRYLKSLVGLNNLERLTGVPVSPGDLDPYGLLPRWNGMNRSDNRICPDRLLEIQQRLTSAWHRASPPVTAQSLSMYLGNAARPFELLKAVVSRIIRGDLARFNWLPPYLWTSIQLEATEWRSMSQGYSASR